MNDAKPTSELLISLNYLFPMALDTSDPGCFKRDVTERLGKVIAQELDRMGVEYRRSSTCYLHLGTTFIPDSLRCSECETWVIPEENSHRTSVVSSGWRVEDGRILCDQCWSLYDGEKIPITG